METFTKSADYSNNLTDTTVAYKPSLSIIQVRYFARKWLNNNKNEPI